eukprot:gene23805-28829_t
MAEALSLPPEIWQVLRPQQHLGIFLKNNVRWDGRSLLERRQMHVKKSPLPLGSDPCLIGSAQIQLGGTMVLAVIKIMVAKHASAEISTLEANQTIRRENSSLGDAVCTVNLDHLLAVRNAEIKSVDLQAVEITGIIEHLLNRGRVLDLGQLTISSALFSYRLCVHLTPLSDDGNLKDASIAAVMVALSSSSLPKAYVQEGRVQIDPDERDPLNVSPVLPVSFAVFQNHVLLDPTRAEQQALSAHPQGGAGTVVTDPQGASVRYLSVEGGDVDVSGRVPGIVTSALGQWTDLLAYLQVDV